MKRGNYVLATKYSDGDPKDHFCVGFFDKMTHHDRFLVVDFENNNFRNNGFRKCVEVSDKVGSKIVSLIPEIEKMNISLWYWLRFVQEVF